MLGNEKAKHAFQKLRSTLRQERESRELTQPDVAGGLGWSVAKLSHIENLPLEVSFTDLKMLLHHYDLPDSRVNELVDLARIGRELAWWHEYREHFPQWTIDWVGLEASSVWIRQFLGTHIPGLLQTSEYTSALFAAYHLDETRQRRGLSLRAQRQQLVSKDGPKMTFIVDASALSRVVGNAETMCNQLIQLRQVSELPNVTIRVMPFSAGVRRGMIDSFTLYGLSDKPEDYALTLDGLDKDELFEVVSEQTQKYVHAFAELEQFALSPEDTIDLINETINYYLVAD